MTDKRATPPDKTIDQLVCLALQEDLGGKNDLTAELIPRKAYSLAQIISRESAVLCGSRWFDRVFKRLDRRIPVEWQVHDGDGIQPNDVLCRLEGPTRALLTGERTALNFLQTLSGTATITREYAQAIAGIGATLLDTRKTIPGLREAQKYAVRCGGGDNHRVGLFDGILIKENHIMAAGSIADAVSAAKHRHPNMDIEVEVESLDELNEALAAGADIIMLDNFSLGLMREAVAVTDGRAKLEASGGFGLQDIRAAAETGVDFISVGALTKHVRAVDLSMRFL